MRSGGHTIPCVLPSGPTVPVPPGRPKRFRALRIAGICLLAAVLAACSEDGKPGPAGGGAAGPRVPPIPTPPPPPPPPLELPEGVPTEEQRIGFYLRILERGDSGAIPWANRQLGKAGPAALRPLAELLERNLRKNTFLANNVLRVFADHVEPKGLVPLLAKTAKSSIGALRKTTAVALGRTGDPEAVPILLDLAAGSAHEQVANAIEALDRIGGEKAARGLLGRFHDVLDPAMRPLAVPVVARHLPEKEALEFLVGLLQAEDPGLRLAGARALEERDDPRGREAAIGLLDEEIPIYRFSALHFLGEEGDPRALPALIEAVETTTPDYSLALLPALGNYDREEARAALWKATGSPVEDVRVEAWFALLEAAPARAEAALRKLLSTGTSGERRTAALALGRTARPELIPGLARALDAEESARTLWPLANALAIQERPEAAMPIVRMMAREKDPDPLTAMIARNASLALRKFETLPDRALETLVDFSRSAMSSLRFNATRTLVGHAEDPDVRDALVARLSDSYGETRVAAAQFILFIADGDLEPLLDAYDRERDRSVAERLASVIRRYVYRWER